MLQMVQQVLHRGRLQLCVCVCVCVILNCVGENCCGIGRNLHSEQQFGSNSWFVELKQEQTERQGQPALVPMKRAALPSLHVTFDSSRATELICTSSYATDVDGCRVYAARVPKSSKESKFAGGGIP